jgi:flavin reductase (DIM6/NTAB) family NADH-FMN oxidoreductase RutF
MKPLPISEALARKYPEWVMWVISVDAEGKPNIMPAGWCMICNASPLMLAVAVGLGRYTHTCLEDTGEFILAFPGEGQEALIDQLGSCSGRDTDKFEKFGLQTEEAADIGVPLVTGCAVAFECHVVSQIELEDHSVFIGEVVAAHGAEDGLSKLENFAGHYAVARPQTAPG